MRVPDARVATVCASASPPLSLTGGRKCDGECRKPLHVVEGTWAYECSPCSLDLCAACAPGGFHPVLAPPIARASRKRARVTPQHRERKGGGSHGETWRPSDARDPADNAATFLLTHLMMDRLPEKCRHRLPKRGRTVGATSGEGNLTQRASTQGSSGEHKRMVRVQGTRAHEA